MSALSKVGLPFLAASAFVLSALDAELEARPPSVAPAGTLRLRLPPGFRFRQVHAQGSDTLFGVVDSSGEKFLALWSSDGRLLRLEPAPFCCGFVAYGEGAFVVSDPYSAFYWVDGEERVLKTGCAPSRLSVAYKQVYPSGDSLLVVGNYGQRGVRALVSVWDGEGNFSRSLVEASGAWAAPQPFASSPTVASANGDTLAVVSEYSGRVYLVSLRERELLRAVNPAGLGLFAEPDSAQGWDYDSFGVYLDRECARGARVLRLAVPLGRLLLLYAAACRRLGPDRYSFNEEPKAHLYNLETGRVVWEGELGFPLGVIGGDTLILRPRELRKYLEGELVKAVVR